MHSRSVVLLSCMHVSASADRDQCAGLQIGYCGLDHIVMDEFTVTEEQIDVTSFCAGYVRWDILCLIAQVCNHSSYARTFGCCACKNVHACSLIMWNSLHLDALQGIQKKTTGQWACGCIAERCAITYGYQQAVIFAMLLDLIAQVMLQGLLLRLATYLVLRMRQWQSRPTASLSEMVMRLWTVLLRQSSKRWRLLARSRADKGQGLNGKRASAEADVLLDAEIGGEQA